MSMNVPLFFKAVTRMRYVEIPTAAFFVCVTTALQEMALAVAVSEQKYCNYQEKPSQFDCLATQLKTLLFLAELDTMSKFQ